MRPPMGRCARVNKEHKMKSFIVFDILSASIRGIGSMSDRQGILTRRERASVFLFLHACVHTGGRGRGPECVL